MNSATLRAFVALPLSSAAHTQLARVQRKLQRTASGRTVRWVPPENIHLTLFFLGEIASARVAPISEALHVVARNVAPFAMTLQDVGAFPNVNRPRVLWVGLEEPSGQLALLHAAVNEALANVGFEPDQRPFHPHLTVGRVNRRASKGQRQATGAAVAELRLGKLSEEPVAELVLFRSELKPTGAEYTALKRFTLAG